MTEVPTPLLVSQWILLLGLGALVFITYRQLAYLLGISTAVTGGSGLDVGEIAPPFDYQGVSSGLGDGRFESPSAPTLLMFATPGCGSCDEAVRNLESVVGRSAQPVDAYVVTEAGRSAVEASDAFRSTSVPILNVDYRVRADLYRTFSSPVLYAIAVDGKVYARDTTANARVMRRMLRAAVDAKTAGDRGEPVARA
jgi:thiol-disulfide isomerase/thioredoxin